MGLFTRSKINSDEFEQLNKILISTLARVEQVEIGFQGLKTLQNSLRGLVNRKINDAAEDDDAAENLKYKDLY